MNTYTTATAEQLELAIRALGDTEFTRQIVQKVYDLGRVDGARDQVQRTQIALQSKQIEDAALSAFPEPKRLPTVAEMRGILSDENTNAAPQEAPAQESHTYVHGINKQPAVAAPVAAILATARASEAYREQGAEFDADAIRAGLEPRGCPTPGACSCPVASVQDGRDGYLKAITRVPITARPSPQAAVAAPEPQPIKDGSWWLIFFEDRNREPEVFTDEHPENVQDVLDIVASYGPYGLDLNDNLRYQILLADEVKRLRERILSPFSGEPQQAKKPTPLYTGPSPQAASEAVKGPEEYQYARRLAEALSERHYGGNKDWRPLPDLMGVLTQIDNMTCRLERPAPPAAAESVSVPRETEGCVLGNIKPDTDSQVFFYEQDFYVLSNFSAFVLVWEGLTFHTSEAAYHWHKFPDHPDLRDSIYKAPSAHEAFKIAEGAKYFRRHDWDDVKVSIMRRILLAKATQHEYVRRKLLATGDRELIEDSWRDDFWGWGQNRNGINQLGKLWMEIRAMLAAAKESP